MPMPGSLFLIPAAFLVGLVSGGFLISLIWKGVFDDEIARFKADFDAHIEGLKAKGRELDATRAELESTRLRLQRWNEMYEAEGRDGRMHQ